MCLIPFNSSKHTIHSFSSSNSPCTPISGTNTTTSMISSKKLIKMARKWQKLAAMSRKRIPFPTIAGAPTTSEVAKGHVVVYTSERRRFVILLVYLENVILRELLRMAEEEIGLPFDGPITFPCDALFMEYAITLIRRNVPKDLEKSQITSFTSDRCSLSSYLHQGQSIQQLPVFGF